MAEPKIIGIHGGKTISSGNVKPLPKQLISVRDSFRLKLQDLLRHLFDGADDALFEMADKAGTNGDQALYFDAMRELRLQKRHIANAVIKELLTSFNTLQDIKRNTEKRCEGVDSLDLVDKDELEINVAIDAMVSRLVKQAGPSIEELTVRTAHILERDQLLAKDFPASPQKICETFATACDCLEFGIRAKLVVLKLFERYVLSKMSDVYKDVNQQLRQAGVLPALVLGNATRKHPQTNQQASQPPKENEHLAPQTIGVQEDVPLLGEEQFLPQGLPFGELRSLLHKGEGGEPNIGSVGSSVSGSPMPSSNVVQLLSAQQNLVPVIGATPNEFERVDFRGLLAGMSQSSDSVSLTSVDSDVISLVSMLFDFILDDRQLQPVMKALIARLQIPILKVAMLDRSFFDRGGHPARKLLNEIASAGLGWTEVKEGKADRLKDKIENIVNEILQNFDSDISLFKALLDDFEKFIAIENKRGQLVEQRTKDAENGRAANDLAKREVESALDTILSLQKSRGQDVPECVEAFLNKAWSRVLSYSYLNAGPNSDDWHNEIRLVKDLVWTVCPDKSEFDVRGKLLKTIPRVMRGCREGLKRIMFDEFEAKELLAQIELSHVTVLNNLQTYEEFAKSAMDDEAVSELVQDTLEIEKDFKQFKQNTDQAATATSERLQDEISDQEASEDHKRDVASVDVDTMLCDQLQEENLADRVPDPGLSVFESQIERLSIGTWFEITKEKNTERCKLAAHIRAVDKFIFVNRSGIKVMEKDKSGFALMLKSGELQVLSDGLLFDRALESVIGSLRGVN